LRTLLYGPNPWGARRLWNLVKWLPLDSPLARSQDPLGAGLGWSTTQELLAQIAEVADVTNVILMQVYGEKNSRVRKPIHIPRPRDIGKEKDKPVMSSEAEIEAFMAVDGIRIKRGKAKK